MVILRNFFSSVPDALAEAATIDGASQRTYLFRILLPLSGAAIATITLFYAVDYIRKDAPLQNNLQGRNLLY